MDAEYSVIPLQQKDIWYVVAHAVLETVVTLVRSEHMLQVVWKAVESWHGRVCGVCCQGESIGAKVKPEWAIQLSWALQLYIHNADPWSMTDRSHVQTMEKTLENINEKQTKQDRFWHAQSESLIITVYNRNSKKNRFTQFYCNPPSREKNIY